MRLQTLKLDLVVRLSAPLVAAVLILGSSSAVLRKQTGFQRSGIWVSAPQFRQLISKTV